MDEINEEILTNYEEVAYLLLGYKPRSWGGVQEKLLEEIARLQETEVDMYEARADMYEAMDRND